MVKIIPNIQREFDRCAGVVYAALAPLGVSFKSTWGGYCKGKVMGTPPHMRVQLTRQYECKSAEIVQKLEEVEKFLNTGISLEFSNSDRLCYGVDD